MTTSFVTNCALFALLALLVLFLVWHDPRAGVPAGRRPSALLFFGLLALIGLYAFGAVYIMLSAL